MPSGDGRWAELSSQHERVIRPGDPEASAVQARSRWAELASADERLVRTADRPSGAAQRRAAAGMRLVAGAA